LKIAPGESARGAAPSGADPAVTIPIKLARSSGLLWQPADTIEQPFGLPRQLGFLEMLQKLRGLVALGLPNSFENAGLSDAAHRLRRHTFTHQGILHRIRATQRRAKL
jgi:hypothetical protein